MGDQGHLYVDGDLVPVYKNLWRHADLILPNQFELEYVFCVFFAGRTPPPKKKTFPASAKRESRSIEYVREKRS